MTFFAKNFRKYLAVQNIIRTFAPAIKRYNVGAIAQLVEQRTENPCVPGSIPGGTTEERVTPKRSNSLFLLIEQRQANLGATRPRVGIANLGLDAPGWQYMKY